MFCEAVRVDAFLSDKDCKKNAQSRISLIKVLSKDLGHAIELNEKSMANITDSQPLDAKIYLFNNANKSCDLDGSLFGQHILNDFDGLDKEVLKLLKSWCMFSYREFYRNLLVLLEELGDWIYGSETNIPNQLLGIFDLDDERISTHLRKWTTNDISGRGFSYSAMINKMRHTVQPESIQTKQFTLDKLVSLPMITAKVGEGWDTPTAKEYFRTNNYDTNDQIVKLMTTLHQFEESYIILSTMKQIKVTMNEKMRGFSPLTVILTSYYEPKDLAICKHHSKLFKDDNYEFYAGDDLIKSMPFEFIHNLEVDKFTTLPKVWHKNVLNIEES